MYDYRDEELEREEREREDREREDREREEEERQREEYQREQEQQRLANEQYQRAQEEAREAQGQLPPEEELPDENLDADVRAADQLLASMEEEERQAQARVDEQEQERRDEQRQEQERRDELQQELERRGAQYEDTRRDDERTATAREEQQHEDTRRDDERTATSLEDRIHEEARRDDERTEVSRAEQHQQDARWDDERKAALRGELIQKYQAREERENKFTARSDKFDVLERQVEEAARVQDGEQMDKLMQEQAELVRQNEEHVREMGEYQRQEEQNAAKSFKGTFADTDAIALLWEQAKQDSKSYDEARSRFWHLTNTSSSPEAKEMRNIVQAAGYKLQGENRAPRLNMDYQLSRPEDAGRQKADLTLSIDHIVPQSDEAGKKRTLDASNLRFMSLRDNSTLGAWNKGKDPEELDTGKTFSKPLSKEENDAYRERVNTMRRKKYGRG